MSDPDNSGEQAVAETLTLQERKRLRVGIGRRIESLTNEEMFGLDLELSAMIWWLSENRALPKTGLDHVCKMIALRLGGRDEKVDLHHVLGYAAASTIVATEEELSTFMDYYYGGSENHPKAEQWEAALEDFLFVIDSVTNPAILED